MLSYYLPPITNTRPARSVALGEVHAMIVSTKWAQTTRSLRSLSQSELSGYKRRQLPFVTFSGLFAMRHASRLICHSGLLCFDFDHVGCEACVRQLQRKLIADPLLDVRLAFRSPSGDGLKLVVKIASLVGLGPSTVVSRERIIEMHNAEYAQIAQHILQRHNIQVDKTSDVARACFLCHDANAYINPNSNCRDVRLERPNEQSESKCRDVRLEHPNEQSESKCRDARLERPMTRKGQHLTNTANPTSDPRPSTVDQKLESAIQRLEANQIDITTRYYDWYRIGMALASHFGEAGRSYYHRISRFYPHYTTSETNKQYDLCLRYNHHRINIGTLFYLMHNS